MSEREVARRVFAREFNDSNLQQGDPADRSPNFIVTPAGVICNRVFIVGVLTEVENIGVEGQSMYRARIADPTGVFTVYAGEYQPSAALFLSTVKTPAYVAVVGKTRVFNPEKDAFYMSVRPEEINLVDEYVRNRWVYMTALFTLEAARNMERAMESGLRGSELERHMRSYTIDSVGIASALDHYMITADRMGAYRQMVMDALATIVDAAPPESPRASGDGMALAIIEDMIKRLDRGDGVSYEALLDAAEKLGYEEAAVEKTLNALMDGGRCYEPRIGILKLI
jgi:RPA family protein